MRLLAHVSRRGIHAGSLAGPGADRSAGGAGRRPGSLAGGRDRETTAPLGAPPLQHIAAGLRLHPRAKAVGTAAADSAGLIGALHGSSRFATATSLLPNGDCGRGSRKAHPSQRASRLSRRGPSDRSRRAPIRHVPMLRCVSVGFQHRDSVRIRSMTQGIRPIASDDQVPRAELRTDRPFERQCHASTELRQTAKQRRLEIVSSLLSASTPVTPVFSSTTRN
jgi:hypothetical protein